jgi:hypothetical protein
VVSTARVAADGTSGDIFSPFHSMQKASPFYLTCSEDFVIHTDAENAFFCKCLPNFAHLCNIKTALVQLALVRGTRRWSQTCGCFGRCGTQEPAVTLDRRRRSIIVSCRLVEHRCSLNIAEAARTSTRCPPSLSAPCLPWQTPYPTPGSTETWRGRPDP